MKVNAHPYHLVRLSPWPLLASGVAFTFVMGIVLWFDHGQMFTLKLSLIIMALIMTSWRRDVVRESTFSGAHTLRVQRGLSYGMILFICSEIMFFMAFFWAFFHSSLSPSSEIGCVWPPTGLEVLNPFGVPLLNTAVLLASGATVTWAHNGLMNNYRWELSWGLGVTVFLGLYFTLLQLAEYTSVSFSLADSVYGSTFFVATGFHGLHVLIGSSFLLVCWTRSLASHFTSSHHKGLEFAAWYWHFVDVVWVFLYLFMYWWAI